VHKKNSSKSPSLINAFVGIYAGWGVIFAAVVGLTKLINRHRERRRVDLAQDTEYEVLSSFRKGVRE
jgi:hypothetical protein